MSGLRMVDMLDTHDVWRMSVQIRNANTDHGMQFTIFRGEMLGVIVDREGTLFWNNFYNEGFKPWTNPGRKITVVKFNDRPSVTSLDDRYYIAGRGTDNKAYIIWTDDFDSWNFVTPSGKVGDLILNNGPSIAAFDGKLFLAGNSASDKKAYCSIIKKDGTIVKNWEPTGSGNMKLSPLLTVYRNDLYCFVAGPSNDNLYWEKYNLTDGKWPGGWEKLTVPAINSNMAATVPYSAELYVAWVGADGKLQYSQFDGKAFSDLEGVAGGADTAKSTAVGMVTFRGRLYITFCGTDKMNN